MSKSDPDVCQNRTPTCVKNLIPCDVYPLGSFARIQSVGVERTARHYCQRSECGPPNLQQQASREVRRETPSSRTAWDRDHEQATARVSTPNPRSSVGSASSMVTRSFLRSLDEPIYVRAVLDDAFKKCCIRSGRYDGSRRNDFFP